MLKLKFSITGADFEGFGRGFFPDSSNSPSHPPILFGVLRWSHSLLERFLVEQTQLLRFLGRFPFEITLLRFLGRFPIEQLDLRFLPG